ncbi:MAG: DUF4179 domain-containing protein [Oscillospiraceae bacterium]
MNNYKKLFEQISPGESDETLVTKVLARKAELMKENNTKKTTKNIFLRKAVVIPAAAVLTLGTATLTVGAVNNWDYSKAFRGMFAAKYEGNASVVEMVKDNPEKTIGSFDFDKYGKSLGIVMQGDGITVTLDGMLVYDDSCYIMYTAEATDELLAKTGGEVPELRFDYESPGSILINGLNYSGTSSFTEPISEEGNTRAGLIGISFDTVDFSGKTLNCDFRVQIQTGDREYTPILKEHKDIEIDVIPTASVEKEISVKLKNDNFDGEINKVKVSGLRSTLFYSGRATGDYYKHYDLEDAVITLKDGTTVVAKRTGSGSGLILEGGSIDWSGQIVLRYTYPIDPADVSSIAFGDYTINF